MGFMRPTLTNTVVEQLDLKNMDFPLVVKVCVKPSFNNTALEEAGYDTTWGSSLYFVGQSKYNSSLFGWVGHTNTSGVQGGVADILGRVFLHTTTSVFEKVNVYTMTDEDVDINLEDHVHIKRQNYPHNCFSIDITKNAEIKQKGIKQLFIHFHKVLNTSVEVFVHGTSLVCNRNIKAHTFYSSDPMYINDMVGTTKRYVVNMKKHVYLEEDQAKRCRKYPNEDFVTYRYK